MQSAAQFALVIVIFGIFIFIGELLRASSKEALGEVPLRDRYGHGE